MKPVCGNARASAIRCSPPPNPISRRTPSALGSNRVVRSATRSADVEREMRQQMLDQVGLMRAQPVALAPPEERALPINRGVTVGRCIAMIRIAGSAAHRSVWYSRCRKPRPRLDRRDVELLIMGMRALTVDRRGRRASR